jgi:putative peptidoglycan lipid II flippase
VGVHLMTLSLGSLGLGVVGETWFILGTYALYSRQDVRAPLRSMLVRVSITLSVLLIAWHSRGPAVLATLGLALSLGSVAGAAHIGWQLKKRLPRTDASLPRSLGRTMVASLVMAGAVSLTTLALGRVAHSHLIQVLEMAVAVLVGLATYLGVQAAWRAPELGWLKAGLRGMGLASRRGR